ncbi:MAG: isoaspartyl peptidase/L-asparaginase [Pseudomonadota bacterium]
MLKVLLGVAAALSLTAASGAQDAVEAGSAPADGGWAVVLHGGAGVIERGDMDEETEAAYRAALDSALRLAGTILADGGSALDAVEAATRELEDDPKFNAGRGAVFTSEGANELDASIMRGSDLQGGAVASVTSVRHPISLARAIMEDNPHVMLMGEGAERFASEQELEFVDPAFFFTERRWASMLRRNAERGMAAPPRPDGAPEAEPIEEGALDLMEREHAFGTVGVVALDMSGEVVAGTSTGGTTAKRWGRVGDSPILGAGNYAAGECGVSATGTGEYFIRRAVASRICMLIDIGGLDAQAAADQVVMDELVEMGGGGGIVMLDGMEPVWSFNTAGMYRAAWTSETEPVVAIYKDEG